MMRMKDLGEQAKALTTEYTDSIKAIKAGDAGMSLADSQAKS